MQKPQESLCPNPTFFTVNSHSRKGLFLHNSTSYTQLCFFKYKRSPYAMAIPGNSLQTHQEEPCPQNCPSRAAQRAQLAPRPDSHKANTGHLGKKKKKPPHDQSTSDISSANSLYPPTIYGLSHHNIGCQARVSQPPGHFKPC